MQDRMPSRQQDQKKMLDRYEKIAREYKEDLIDQAEKEINKIKDLEFLQDLKKLIDKINDDRRPVEPQWEYKKINGKKVLFLVEVKDHVPYVLNDLTADPLEQERDIKSKIHAALLNQYDKSFGEKNKEVSEKLKDNKRLITILERHRVIDEALYELYRVHPSEKAALNNQAIKDFNDYIDKSLMKDRRRDSGLALFQGEILLLREKNKNKQTEKVQQGWWMSILQAAKAFFIRAFNFLKKYFQESFEHTVIRQSDSQEIIVISSCHQVLKKLEFSTPNNNSVLNNNRKSSPVVSQKKSQEYIEVPVIPDSAALSQNTCISSAPQIR